MGNKTLLEIVKFLKEKSTDKLIVFKLPFNYIRHTPLFRAVRLLKFKNDDHNNFEMIYFQGR
jgi:hypothetical protein